MGRRGYPAEFRRKVLDLVESGRPVADVARALGISDQTNFTWAWQYRIAQVWAPARKPSSRPRGGPWSWYGRPCPQKSATPQ